MFPGSSVVEQVTVNHLVAGSNPARGATFSKIIISVNIIRLRDEVVNQLVIVSEQCVALLRGSNPARGATF